MSEDITWLWSQTSGVQNQISNSESDLWLQTGISWHATCNASCGEPSGICVDYQVKTRQRVGDHDGDHSCGVTHLSHSFLLTINMCLLSICMEWTIGESLLNFWELWGFLAWSPPTRVSVSHDGGEGWALSLSISFEVYASSTVKVKAWRYPSFFLTTRTRLWTQHEVRKRALNTPFWHAIALW